MNNKKWSIGCLLLTLALLVLGALPTVVVDPYYHYHKPLDRLTMILDNQRYQNDGILKHFDYDAILTGTSMTENFSTTEADALFGVRSVKVPYFGASFKEIGDSLENAFRANPGIRYVIRGIDCNRIIEHKDAMNYETGMYPEYLYDWKLYNDVSYVFNKQVLFGDVTRVLAYSLAGIPDATFDAYSYWSDDYTYGAEAVLETYDRPVPRAEERSAGEEDLRILRESMLQNFINQAKANPDTEFYYFFAPYSIYWWDSIRQTGQLKLHVQLMQEASRMMVEYDNIHLFSFFDAEELICDPDNYKDTLHYSGQINSKLLEWMRNGEFRLTADNYASHWEAVLDFYSSYDYDKLFS